MYQTLLVATCERLQLAGVEVDAHTNLGGHRVEMLMMVDS